MRLWEPPCGVRLVATDANWAHGEGVEKRALIQSHLLTLTGRQRASSQTSAATQ
jgi:hypothetical protein